MRTVASLLVVAALLPALASGASSTEVDSVAIRVVLLKGQTRMLSVHDTPFTYGLSPDLTRFVYVPSSPDGGPTNELRSTYVRRLQEQVLVQAPSAIVDVAWAPNGSAIALSVYDSGLWLVNPDGSAMHRIADFVGSLAWSPDSRELAVHHPVGGTPGTISVLTIDNGAVRDVAMGTDPSWSPDGESLLFTGPDEPTAVLPPVQIVRATGGEVRTVARGRAGSWSPRGKRITFTRPLGKEPSSLWVVPSQRGKAKLVAHWANEGIWSPNGRRIAFLKTREAHVCSARYRTTLGFVPSGGGTIRVLTRTREAVKLLTWSRDGSRVLYFSYLCPPG